MRHAGNLAQLRLVQGGIRHHDAEACIADKLVVIRKDAFLHPVCGTAEPIFVLRQKAGDLPARLPVEDIAEGIQGYDRADLQRSERKGIAADPGFHAGVHPCTLSNRCPAARAVVSVPVIRRFQSAFRRFQAHLPIRAGCHIPYRQVKEIRLCHQRHPGHANIKTDPVLLQASHDAACRTQAESASACEDNAVDQLGAGKGVQQLALSGSRAAASDVKAGAHPLFADEHGASRAPGGILHLANPDPEFRDGYLLYAHMLLSFPPCRFLAVKCRDKGRDNQLRQGQPVSVSGCA